MIPGADYLATIQRRLENSPPVSLPGPRQDGKTTLAKEVAAGTASPCSLDVLCNDQERFSAELTRVFLLVALPVPSDRERSQLHLQRHMQHFPAAGEVVIQPDALQEERPARGGRAAAALHEARLRRPGALEGPEGHAGELLSRPAL